MTAATHRRNRRATTRSHRAGTRASGAWAVRLRNPQTMQWGLRGVLARQYQAGTPVATYSYTDINNNLRVAQDAAGLTTSTYDGDNLRRKIVSGSVTTPFVWKPSSLRAGHCCSGLAHPPGSGSGVPPPAKDFLNVLDCWICRQVFGDRCSNPYLGER